MLPELVPVAVLPPELAPVGLEEPSVGVAPEPEDVADEASLEPVLSSVGVDPLAAPVCVPVLPSVGVEPPVASVGVPLDLFVFSRSLFEPDDPPSVGLASVLPEVVVAAVLLELPSVTTTWIVRGVVFGFSDVLEKVIARMAAW